jgi:hypothetical protein
MPEHPYILPPPIPTTRNKSNSSLPHRHIDPKMFRPSKPEDWEQYREVIANLYNSMKLKDVMTEMQVSYNFKATEKQYKTQLKKWNLDTKYIKASEYMAMIKTKRERERENPPKQTRFILRGRVVDPKDITRFEKRAHKKGKLNAQEEDYDQEAVEELLYDTPPPEEQQEYTYAEASGSYDTTQYASSGYDPTAYDTTQYTAAQYDATQYSTAQYDNTQYQYNY